MNTREKVLKEALNYVNDEREKPYGNLEDNFAKIAEFWSLYLTSLFDGTDLVIKLDPKDVAMMMILSKIARSSGDQDKLDDYVDIIRYAASGAEILEERETKTDVDLESKMIESRSCSKKAPDNTKDFLKNDDPYSYFYDKLANYASDRAKSNKSKYIIPLNHFKNINWEFSKELSELLNKEATDCVINGKKLIDSYKEIDVLLEKYINKFENIDKSKYKEACCKAYDRIASYLIDSSNKANISLFKVVDRLIKNYHSPTTMASLIAQGKISFDDITPYIDDTIAELSGIRRIDKDE